MRAFSRVPVARALPASTTLTSRALYTTYRASVPALGPLESRRGRVENAGVNDPALNPLKEAASEKADQAKNAFKSAAHAAGADDALHRASDAASGMGEKIKKAAHDMEDKAMAPEVRKYPVEFSMATGGAVVGVGLMLWWMYMYMRPQHSIENEAARTGGQGVEDAKKIVEAQKASTKKMV